MQVCGKHSLHRHFSWASPASSSQCSCADRPGGPLTVLNFWLPSQPAWPCVPGGVNWCSPNANKTGNEHPTGQSCAMGAGSKGLEAFDGEEMMNVGAGATLCYKTNRNKSLTMQSQMCAGHQPLSPNSASQTNLCLCYRILVGLWQNQFKDKRISESKLPKTIHKGLPSCCNSFI